MLPTYVNAKEYDRAKIDLKEMNYSEKELIICGK
jgi:hypothetical protein